MRHSVSTLRSTRMASPATFSEDVELAGRVTVPVLIVGPNHRRREECARVIHDLRDAHREPFVAIPACRLNAAPGLSLGAPAVGTRSGDGASRRTRSPGTLFFDDIAELTAAGQEWLLELLDRRQPSRAGAPTRGGAYVISGSSHGLEWQRHSGQFSERLFYRLNVILIELS